MFRFVVIFVFVGGVSPFRNDKSAKEAINASNFPCDTKVVVAFDNSKELNSTSFMKEKNFLINQTFGAWTRFNNLSLLAYSNTTDAKYFGNLTSYNDVYNFVNSTNQSSVDPDVCSLFGHLNGIEEEKLNIVVFLTYFSDSKPTSNYCLSNVDSLKLKLHRISFITLTNGVNSTYLTKMFRGSTTTIINWMINKEGILENYEQVLWEAYGCKGLSPQKQLGSTKLTAETTTTMSITSERLTPSKKSSTNKITTTTRRIVATKTPDKPQMSDTAKLALYLGISLPIVIILLLAFMAFCYWRERRLDKEIEGEIAVLASKRIKVNNNLYEYRY